MCVLAEDSAGDADQFSFAVGAIPILLSLMGFPGSSDESALYLVSCDVTLLHRSL